jgi:hypothetical protein
MVDGPDISYWGLTLLAAYYLIRQLVLYDKDFGRMAFWELRPEVSRSHWFETSATWGGGVDRFG